MDPAPRKEGNSLPSVIPRFPSKTAASFQLLGTATVYRHTFGADKPNPGEGCRLGKIFSSLSPSPEKGVALSIREARRVNDIVDILGKVPLFSGLQTEDLQTLATIVSKKEYTKKETLFHQGDPGEEFMILAEGSVKVELMNAEGKELTLTILTPYQFLGELALLDDVPRSATVISMENSTLLSINKRDFARILESYPRMSVPMLRQLTRRVRVLTDDIASMAFLDSYSRVTRKLLTLAGEMGQATDDGHVLIDRALTHQQLANLVGTTRETVTKILNEMKDNGLLSIRRHRITILDTEELLARADLSGIM